MKNKTWLLMAGILAVMFIVNPFSLRGDEGEDIDDDDRPRSLKVIYNEVFEDEDDLNRDKIMAFMNKHFPEFAAELPVMAKVESGKHMCDYLEDLFHEFNEMMELQEEEPAEFKIMLANKKEEFKSQALGRKIHQLRKSKKADKAEIDKLEKEIMTLLENLFAKRIEQQKKELKHLQNEMNEIKNLIKRKEQNKDLIIRKRFLELTGQDDSIEW